MHEVINDALTRLAALRNAIVRNPWPDTMNFSLIDLGGLTLAVAAYGLVLLLPGAALAALSGAIGFRDAGAQAKPLIAIVTGLAVLPAIDSMTARFAGLDVALVLNLALACTAIGLAARQRWVVSIARASAALLAVWFAVLVFETIDFDVKGGLYQPFTVVDMVKHAATTQALQDTGAPARDPFFFRPERISYYYFFYTLCALAERLCGGLIDARAAVAGLAFWTGAGLYAVARLLLVRTGLVAHAAEKHIRMVLLLLLAASGLDIVVVLRMGLLQNDWLPDPTYWNDEVAGWLEALVWVPHHLCGLIASLVGFIILSDGITLPTRRAAPAIAMAGLCFASALGLSVWLTLVAVATVGLWLVVLFVERRWRAAGIVVVSGFVALLIAAPAILDIRAGRTGVPAIEFAIRAFTPVDAAVTSEPLRSIVRLVALPLNYFAEFGILFFGALFFWQAKRIGDVHRNELARVVTLSAIAGLLLGTFLRSTFFQNNDLGWRVLMFPQMAGLIWTAAILIERWQARPMLRSAQAWRLLSPASLVVLLLGYGTTLYTIVSLRAYGQMPLKQDSRLFSTDPPSDRAKRVAYTWANQNLPRDRVLQHSPILGKRAVNFGLYSRNPVGVSDSYGSLYGASTLMVETRLRDVIPVFTDDLTDADVKTRALANGIDDLLVTADDAVWTMPNSWVWRATPIYQSAFVRIVSVAAIAPPQVGSLP